MLKQLLIATSVAGMAHATEYANFPVTLNGYDGEQTDSTAYTGQAARQVLHTSIKELIGEGASLETLLSYYEGSDEALPVIAPVSDDGFTIAQSDINAIATGKNLSGKAYGGLVSGWPGQMTGDEVLRHLLEKAAETENGYDPVNGYDYRQLFSKFAMGAVFYNQAADVYLDERITAASHRNDEPYKPGAYYTGKEHVWDEGFGYFGAPAHALTLDPATVYNIAKTKADAFAAADADNSGAVDLVTEMTYAHAYYAANADKSGRSNYLATIMQAFVDGRQLIADADGAQLSESQLDQLNEYADIIKSNWERVIAEAAFKYAGSVYNDIVNIQQALADGSGAAELMPIYAKHWGELKGFAMSLQTGGKDLGALGVQIDRLIGYSPVLLGDTQVTGIDEDGNFIQSNTVSMTEYAQQMLELQNLLAQNFHLTARSNDMLGDLEGLADKLGSGGHVEND